MPILINFDNSSLHVWLELFKICACHCLSNYDSVNSFLNFWVHVNYALRATLWPVRTARTQTPSWLLTNRFLDFHTGVVFNHLGQGLPKIKFSVVKQDWIYFFLLLWWVVTVVPLLHLLCFCQNLLILLVKRGTIREFHQKLILEMLHYLLFIFDLPRNILHTSWNDNGVNLSTFYSVRLLILRQKMVLSKKITPL